jgi:hypothetical protein
VLEAFVKLHQDLTKTLGQNPTLPLTIEQERALYASVLMNVAQFVATTIDGRIANTYLFELASALGDLDRGIVRPLLKPSPLRNRPPDPSNRWRARSRVALALDALMRSGLDRTKAANKIARDKKLRALAGKRARKFPATIIGWRNEFRAGRVDDFEATVLFAEGVRLISEMEAAGDFEALKKFAADQLRDACTSSDL